MKRSLQFPEHVHQILLKQYRNRCRKWLANQGNWPLAISLGCPKESEVIEQPDTIRTWGSTWQIWQGPGELIWCKRRWRILGTQRLPERLILHSPEEVAVWVGEAVRWKQAESRYKRLLDLWPALQTCLSHHFEVLADYTEEDIERLIAMLKWLETNPSSNLYPRQLPIAGVDTKWLEARRTLITELLSTLQEHISDTLDFYQSCGLKKSPNVIRMRVLDQVLRDHLGGLSDITAPLKDFAQLNIPISHVFIVENLQTGLAFEDLPGAIVLMGLGYNVDVLSYLPWLNFTDCTYWGDLDTHGFAILSRARSYLPNLKSVLMDETTLLNYQALWVDEKGQHLATELPFLTNMEQAVYQRLKQQFWGENIRLEQERIPWDYAWQIINKNLITKDQFIFK